MADFETHVQYGTVGHLFVSVGAVIAVGLGAAPTILVGVVVGYLATLAGAGFPDVDHPSSKPYLLARVWLPRIIASVVGITLVARRSLVIDLIATSPLVGAPSFTAGAVCTAIIIGVYRATRRGIPLLRPPHRTVTHNVGLAVGIAAFLTATVTTIGLALDAPTAYGNGVVVGSCFVTGVITHLLVDGELPGIPSRRTLNED
ncbi:metal-dependent hydrolase [Halopiger aswanensis]|uniref:LexA-binding, inner membrane-associated putative hydrolase n=1 Tax=Halopiger aswanensis TaxID=148449 RepID=A0A419VVN6_9EURY|nr:metal-dependent hydrolase [Halopiger aswanensis]RKD86227.1 LexA-binding, inner membrane-associated putative hydrolase [Halopiger aswanensis]